MSHDCHNCHSHASPYAQTLDEIEFDRGPWNPAIHGASSKLTELLKKGIDVNSQDNYGYTALVSHLSAN